MHRYWPGEGSVAMQFIMRRRFRHLFRNVTWKGPCGALHLFKRDSVSGNPRLTVDSQTDCRLPDSTVGAQMVPHTTLIKGPVPPGCNLLLYVVLALVLLLIRIIILMFDVSCCVNINIIVIIVSVSIIIVVVVIAVSIVINFVNTIIICFFYNRS